MKTTLFLLCVACTCPLSAQEAEPVHYGLKVGLNSSSFAHEEGVDSQTRTGIVAGGFAHVPLTEIFGLQVEGLFTQKGTRVGGRDFPAADGQPGSTNIPESISAIDFIEIPVLAKLELVAGKTIRSALLAGAAFGFRIRNDFELRGRRFNQRTSYGRFTNDRERSWVVGFEIQIPMEHNAMLLEARYTRAATPVFDTVPEDDDFDDEHQVLAVMIGVSF